MLQVGAVERTPKRQPDVLGKGFGAKACPLCLGREIYPFGRNSISRQSHFFVFHFFIIRSFELAYRVGLH
jgi:hypothetical protein